MAGVKGKSGGKREGAGRKLSRVTLRVGKEIALSTVDEVRMLTVESIRGTAKNPCLVTVDEHGKQWVINL